MRVPLYYRNLLVIFIRVLNGFPLFSLNEVTASPTTAHRFTKFHGTDERVCLSRPVLGCSGMARHVDWLRLKYLFLSF